MSNRVSLISTKFTNICGAKDESYGFIIYDNYGHSYNNFLEKPITDDMELLKYLIDSQDLTENEYIKNVISFIKEEECGIEINGNWYDWDEILDYV